MISSPHEFDQYCLFQILQNEFALSASFIREIATLPNCTPVPCSSPMLIGMSHVENEFLPVVDCFPEGRSERLQMLVLTGTAGAWGLLVDSVTGLAHLELSTSESRNADFATGFEIGPAVVGSAIWRDRAICVLDASALTTHVETELRNHWHSSLSIVS